MISYGISPLSGYTRTGHPVFGPADTLPCVSRAVVSSKKLTLRLGPAALEYTSQSVTPGQKAHRKSLAEPTGCFAETLARQIMLASRPGCPDSVWNGENPSSGIPPALAAEKYLAHSSQALFRPDMISVRV